MEISFKNSNEEQGGFPSPISLIKSHVEKHALTEQSAWGLSSRSDFNHEHEETNSEECNFTPYKWMQSCCIYEVWSQKQTFLKNPSPWNNWFLIGEMTSFWGLTFIQSMSSILVLVNRDILIILTPKPLCKLYLLKHLEAIIPAVSSTISYKMFMSC